MTVVIPTAMPSMVSAARTGCRIKFFMTRMKKANAGSFRAIS
jgi:hypothetical protein